MLLQNMQEQVEDFGYRTRRTAAQVGGKTALAAMKVASGTGLGALASGTLSTLKQVLGYTGIGLGVALNAYLIESDHTAREERILRFYRDEVAAVRGVAPRDVTLDDLHAVAEQVPALEQTLSDNNRERYSRHAAWLGSALITNGLMIGYVAAVAISLAAGSVFMTGALLALSATVIFQASRHLTEPLAEKLFSVHHDGVQERMEAIQHQLGTRRAQPVSQAQVLEVLAMASPVLNEQIEQHYGAPFQHLAPNAQRHAVEEYRESYGLEAVTSDLNAGRIRVQELPFMAVGRVSGVAPRTEGVRHVEDQMLHTLNHSVAQGREQLGQVAHRVSSSVKETAHHVQHSAHETAARVKDGFKSQGMRGAWTALAERGNTRKAPDQAWGDYVQNATPPELKR
jgi:hypothetical protein